MLRLDQDLVSWLLKLIRVCSLNGKYFWLHNQVLNLKPCSNHLCLSDHPPEYGWDVQGIDFNFQCSRSIVVVQS